MIPNSTAAASAGMGAEPSPWLVIEEARKIAKVGPKLLYREIKSGRLRAARLGGRSGAIRIHRTWLDEWLERASEPIEIRR
jgi:excisionase family DNA binding protein